MVPSMPPANESWNHQGWWMNWLILAMFPFFFVSNDAVLKHLGVARFSANLTFILSVPSSIFSQNREKNYLWPQYNQFFAFSRKNGELNFKLNWSYKLAYFYLCIIWLPDYPLSWWTLGVSYVTSDLLLMVIKHFMIQGLIILYSYRCSEDSKVGVNSCGVG